MSATFKKSTFKSQISVFRTVLLPQRAIGKHLDLSHFSFLVLQFCQLLHMQRLERRKTFTATCCVTNQELLLHPKYNKASTFSVDKKSKFFLLNHRKIVSRRNVGPN